MQGAVVRGSIAAFVAFAMVAIPRAGKACTGPLANACRGARVAAAPANAQVFVLTSVYGTDLTFKAPNIAVKDASENPVEVIVTADAEIANRWIVRPSAPLTAGATYKVSWQPLCSSEELQYAARYGASDPTEAAVVVPDAAPFPTTLGTAVVDRAPIRYTHVPSSCSDGSIDGTFQAVIARVRLEPDPAFLPFQDVADVRLTVDGVVPEDLRPEKVGYENRSYTPHGGDPMASCDPKFDTGISPGVHKVGFRAWIPGLTTPLTAEATVDFSCVNAAPEPGAGASSADPDEGGGCATATGRTTMSGAAGAGHAALLAVTIVVRRRRKVRRRGH